MPEDNDGSDSESRVSAHDQRARRDQQPTSAPQVARSTPKRKATNTLRKEEKEALSREIEQLEDRLAELRERVYRREAAAPMTGDGRAAPMVPNILLCEAIHEQQLGLAGSRSLISQFLSSEMASPVHTYIHLTRDPRQRHEALTAARGQQLHLARRYMLERSRYQDLSRPHSSQERFVTPSRDACYVRFSVDPLPGRLRVWDIFEAVSFHTSTIEISLTDAIGELIIREDDDSGDVGMSQLRLVMSTQTGLQVESHIAVFAQFDDHDDYGLITATFVDQDDLHPYQTASRIRQDVTMVFMVSKEAEGARLVIRRMAHIRLHRNLQVPGSDNLLPSLTENVLRWGDSLLETIRNRFSVREEELESLR